MRIVEPETFDSYGIALWFSVVTVATVGLRRHRPGDRPGRGRRLGDDPLRHGLDPLVASLVVTALTQVFTRAQREEHARSMRHIEERLDELQRQLRER